MQAFKQLIESYLGVPDSPTGQGTAWTWQHSLPNIPTWVSLLIVACLCGFIFYVYHRDAHFLPRRIRALMVGLRLAVVAIVVLFISGLALSVDRTDLPLVVVLIDDSASMSFDDHYQNAALAASGVSMSATSAGDNASRLGIVQSLLTDNDAQLLKQLAENYRLRVYRFSDSAVLLNNDDASDGDFESLVRQIQSIEPLGEETRPGPAAKQVLDDFRGQSPSAIIVFTDGIPTVNDSEQLSSTIPMFRQQGIPVFTVGIGSQQLARDIQVYDVIAGEVAFVDDPIVFAGKVKAAGELAGQSVNVVLRQKESSKVLAQTTVNTPETGEAIPFDFTYTPTKKGDYEFVVAVDPLPDETDGQNNSEIKQVSVRDEKIRVLMVDSIPRYEFRHLKYLLEREATVELKTVLFEADVEFTSEDKTALENFPLRKEELALYDVIIFGDVDPSQLNPRALEQLVEFVRDEGGSLLAIAGENHLPQDYANTPLADILPAEIEPFDLKSQELVTQFLPQLTIDGQKGIPVFRLSNSEAEDAQLWKQFPTLRWMLLFGKLKAGTRVFMEYTIPETPPRTFPVIMMHQYGAGRVLMHASDELWRWKFRQFEEYYQKYWIQMLRYLSRIKQLGQQRAIDLDVDRRKYRQGEAVLFRARFFQQDAKRVRDDNVTVVIERQGGEQQQLELAPVPDIPFVFEGQVDGLREGNYRGWVVDPSFSDKPPSTEFSIELTQQEFHDYQLREKDLQKTATDTRGAYYTPANADKLIGNLPPGEPILLAARTRISLWNRIELLLLFILLLATEWLMRKRFRLI